MDEKYGWYKCWCQAVDRKREYLQWNDYYNAMKQADIAIAISIGFGGKFGMDFGEYVRSIMK